MIYVSVVGQWNITSKFISRRESPGSAAMQSRVKRKTCGVFSYFFTGSSFTFAFEVLAFRLLNDQINFAYHQKLLYFLYSLQAFITFMEHQPASFLCSYKLNRRRGGGSLAESQFGTVFFSTGTSSRNLVVLYARLKMQPELVFARWKRAALFCALSLRRVVRCNTKN